MRIGTRGRLHGGELLVRHLFLRFFFFAFCNIYFLFAGMNRRVLSEKAAIWFPRGTMYAAGIAPGDVPALLSLLSSLHYEASFNTVVLVL